MICQFCGRHTAKFQRTVTHLDVSVCVEVCEHCEIEFDDGGEMKIPEPAGVLEP